MKPPINFEFSIRVGYDSRFKFQVFVSKFGTCKITDIFCKIIENWSPAANCMKMVLK